MGFLFALVLSLLAVFLIMLVLVQRGRGGGLSGALGGMGGSSAFGAKAGDVFTKITIGAASVWIFVCVCAAFWAGNRGDRLGDDAGGDTLSTVSAEDVISAPETSDTSSSDSTTGPALTPPESTGSADDAAGE